MMILDSGLLFFGHPVYVFNGKGDHAPYL